MTSTTVTNSDLGHTVTRPRGQLLRLLVGVNIMWLSLSMLSDGLSTLVLPIYLMGFDIPFGQATLLGLATFFGIAAGMLVQPLFGALSDRLRPRWGRRGMLAVGTLLLILALGGLLITPLIAVVITVYLAVQVSASATQAALQGFIPDLIPRAWRGRAAGIKSFLDIGGAMLGFLLLGDLLGQGHVFYAVLALMGVLLASYGLTILLVKEPKQPNTRGEASQFSLAGVFQLDFREHSVFVRLIAARFLFLLGTYAVGRFLVFFISDRLALAPNQAAEQAGILLAGLAFITVAATIPAGWLADRLGRRPLMIAGAALSAAGVLLFIIARSPQQLLVFGALMSLGSGAFSSANWAITADVVPRDQAARFMAIANFGTAGATAAAGLLGPLVDMAEALSTGSGYLFLFLASAVSFIASALVIYGMRERVGEAVFS